MDEGDFVEGLMRHFREFQTLNEADLNLTRVDYVSALFGFSPSVLDEAFRRLVREHENPWFPKIAECLRYCRKIKDEEEYRKQQTAELAAEGVGIERLSTGIATTKAFTRKIHRACGKEAYRFIDVWKIVKAKCQHMPDDKLASGLLYAAHLLCQGRAPHDAVRCAFPECRV